MTPKPGRPKVYQTPRERVEVKLSLEAITLMDSVTMNRSTFINDLILSQGRIFDVLDADHLIAETDTALGHIVVDGATPEHVTWQVTVGNGEPHSCDTDEDMLALLIRLGVAGSEWKARE